SIGTSVNAKYDIPGYTGATTGGATANANLTTFWANAGSTPAGGTGTNTLVNGAFPSNPSGEVNAFNVKGIVNTGFSLAVPLTTTPAGAGLGWEDLIPAKGPSNPVVVTSPTDSSGGTGGT